MTALGAVERVYIELTHPDASGKLRVTKEEIAHQPFVWLTAMFTDGSNYGKRLIAIHHTLEPRRGILTGATLLGRYREDENGEWRIES